MRLPVFAEASPGAIVPFIIRLTSRFHEYCALGSLRAWHDCEKRPACEHGQQHNADDNRKCNVLGFSHFMSSLKGTSLYLLDGSRQRLTDTSCLQLVIFAEKAQVAESVGQVVSVRCSKKLRATGFWTGSRPEKQSHPPLTDTSCERAAIPAAKTQVAEISGQVVSVRCGQQLQRIVFRAGSGGALDHRARKNTNQHSSTPTRAPEESSSTSVTMPARPETNIWCTSSEEA